ncbi:AtpZ/AtpI family protein [Niabella aquatica]
METKKYSPWLRYMGITAQLLVIIGLAVYGGIWLDEKFSLAPLLTVTLPLLVLAVTFYKLIKETGKKNKDNGSK